MIGDRLTEIDVAVGSLMPDDPNMLTLQDLRRLLDSRQLMLTREMVNDNTPRFQQAAERLRQVNLETSAAIRGVDDVVLMIQNVTRFLDAVTTFLGVVRAPN